MLPVSQGANAVRTGLKNEKAIRCMLSDRGYIIKRHIPICTGIYGKKLYTDLYVTGIPSFPQGLAIECKWQEVAGSNDEKLPYLVANIKERFPCPAVIVIDGTGWRQGAIDYIMAQVDGIKLIRVCSLGEFLEWANRDLEQGFEFQVDCKQSKFEV